MKSPKTSLKSGGKINWLRIAVILSLVILFCSPLVVIYLNLQAIYSTSYEEYRQGYYRVDFDVPVTVGGVADTGVDTYCLQWFWFICTYSIQVWKWTNLDTVWLQMSPVELDHLFYPSAGAQATSFSFMQDKACAGGDYKYSINVKVYDMDKDGKLVLENTWFYNQKQKTTATHHLQLSIPCNEDGYPSDKYKVVIKVNCGTAGGQTVGIKDPWGKRIPSCSQSWNVYITPDPDLALIQMTLYQIRDGYEQTYGMMFFLLVLPLAICVGYIFGERRNIWLIVVLLAVALLVGLMNAGMYMQIFNDPASAPVSLWDLGGFLNGVMAGFYGFGASAQSQFSMFWNTIALELVSISMGIFGGYLLFVTKKELR